MPSKQPKTLIPCPHCQGAGTKPLSSELAETLRLLRVPGEAFNGAQLARLVGVKLRAMNSRLIKLERLGLAVGEVDGRQRLWRAAEVKG